MYTYIYITFIKMRSIPRTAVLPQDEHPSGQRSMWEAPGEERRPRARRPSDGPSPSSEAPVPFLLSSVFPSVHRDTASPDRELTEGSETVGATLPSAE